MGSVTVAHLGKAYKQYPRRWGRLVEWLWPAGGKRHQLHWVLQDINFTIQPGEAVGIVGINGAGKSTLLKMLTGTLRPTTGSVQMTGKVAAMLELGMGFHPDFTGRQNAIMAGQLLGLSTVELDGLMPDIIDFAEIGDYIDQPVRVYSSGMQMRLAFSVASVRRPDVLIVDEALSVGDAYFQHKSFERIRSYRRQGTTLLLVSHDKQAIQSICDRALLLNGGALAMEGDPESVMDYYNALLADHQNQTVSRTLTEDGKTQTRSGTGEAGVVSIVLLDHHGTMLEVVDVGQWVRLQVDVDVKAHLPRLVFGYAIKDRLGQVIYGTNTDLKEQPLCDVEAGCRYRFEVDFPANLGPGSYSVVTALTSSDTHLVNNYEWRDLALIFTVVNKDKPFFEGTCWIESTISIEQL
jgi:ABC-type polysaccharide/polyol phosphate transport system, ATPase component